MNNSSISRVATVLENELPQSKNLLLYEHSKKSYDDENLLFRTLDEKASKFISLISILITLITIATPFLINQIQKIDHDITYIIQVTLLLSIVSLSTAWLQSLRVIKLADLRRIPLDDQVFLMIKEMPIEKVYMKFSTLYKNALVINKLATQKKSLLLSDCYNLLLFSASCIAITTILLAPLAFSQA